MTAECVSGVRGEGFGHRPVLPVDPTGLDLSEHADDGQHQADDPQDRGEQRRGEHPADLGEELMTPDERGGAALGVS
ncbi:MAG: hypothetical protein L0G94_08235 [Brachybacterium sp.]|uniref:hypothetical protein n=1 Tax=Brachybacterium sp. TaxID=1891286 RepID=UPI002647D13E|nr:hypothetical protein [Brachybacterium sp.]MDN5686653.1 hypothetical protein [Brachybacterium sp.]